MCRTSTWSRCRIGQFWSDPDTIRRFQHHLRTILPRSARFWGNPAWFRRGLGAILGQSRRGFSAGFPRRPCGHAPDGSARVLQFPGCPRATTYHRARPPRPGKAGPLPTFGANAPPTRARRRARGLRALPPPRAAARRNIALTAVVTGNHRSKTAVLNGVTGKSHSENRCSETVT